MLAMPIDFCAWSGGSSPLPLDEVSNEEKILVEELTFV